MATWDIQVNETRSVIGRTARAAEGFEDQGQALVTELNGALGQAPGKVGEVLNEFWEHTLAQVNFLAQRSNDAMTAGARAVNAYNQGDHDMVLNAQRNAQSAPDPRL